MVTLDFSKTILLLKKYKRLKTNELSALHFDLILESIKRLKQLEFLMKRVNALEDEYSKQIERDLPFLVNNRALATSFFEPQERLSLEIEIYTESIYYFAFRLRKIIRLLPGLKSFESRGIRDVRNHLIEHSDGSKSLITTLSFGHGPNGPEIKPGRIRGQVGKFLDNGLFVNLEEFVVNLNKAIKNAI